jgi:hypothetical protein
VTGLTFIDNYYYGLTIGQKEFDENIVNSDAYILTKNLTKEEYLETMVSPMTDVTETASPVIDIWNYIKDLVYENIVIKYVWEKNLVEKAYRNGDSSFDHILLPTNENNVFVIIVVNINDKNIYGHYRLDLIKEYS